MGIFSRAATNTDAYSEEGSLPADKPGYGRWRFGPEKVVKWNSVFRIRRTAGIEPGEYSVRNFVVVGDRETVRGSLAELHRLFSK